MRKTTVNIFFYQWSSVSGQRNNQRFARKIHYEKVFIYSISIQLEQWYKRAFHKRRSIMYIKRSSLLAVEEWKCLPAKPRTAGEARESSIALCDVTTNNFTSRHAIMIRPIILRHDTCHKVTINYFTSNTAGYQWCGYSGGETIASKNNTQINVLVRGRI